MRDVLDDHAPDALAKLRGLDGLFAEVLGTTLEGRDRHADVAVAREKEDRQVDSPASHLLLELEPAHAGHAHVKHEASGVSQIVPREELLGALVGDGVDAAHAEH